MITTKTKLSVTLVARGRRRIQSIDQDAPVAKPKPRGKVPRISRLMGLAIRFDQMIRSGEFTDTVDLARHHRVSQPRMSQIMSLNLLAPDIQEDLLYLPPETERRPFFHEKRLRPITGLLDWSDQRVCWQRMLVQYAAAGGPDRLAKTSAAKV